MWNQANSWCSCKVSVTDQSELDVITCQSGVARLPWTALTAPWLVPRFPRGPVELNRNWVLKTMKQTECLPKFRYYVNEKDFKFKDTLENTDINMKAKLESSGHARSVGLSEPYQTTIFKLMALRDTLVYDSKIGLLTNFGFLFPMVCFVFVSGQAL